MIAHGPPLIPDGDEAREWAERELSRPVYAEAQPTPLDRIARAVAEFFEDLLSSELPGGWSGPLALVVALVLTGLLVAAFLIWGRPRLSARSAPSPLELFGEEERRSAAQLRRAAAAEAAAGRWEDAIVLRFRALARGVVERGVLEPAPGATVHAFARQAALAFPVEVERLDAAASAFDDVRYLRRPGTAALYARVADADDALVAARSISTTVPA
ncbi:DUF4129 domain-containing protein [Microbacterium sp. DT81.1]|uniref:DUF4129 domain-containing protein n=1 Tax=Microbacterium sp. DT81.1 TaxID=3393413 RepID=UPI003CE8E4BD